jgi:hypothetical protein
VTDGARSFVGGVGATEPPPHDAAARRPARQPFSRAENCGDGASFGANERAMLQKTTPRRHRALGRLRPPRVVTRAMRCVRSQAIGPTSSIRATSHNDMAHHTPSGHVSLERVTGPTSGFRVAPHSGTSRLERPRLEIVGPIERHAPPRVARGARRAARAEQHHAWREEDRVERKESGGRWSPQHNDDESPTAISPARSSSLAPVEMTWNVTTGRLTNDESSTAVSPARSSIIAPELASTPPLLPSA